MKIKKILIMKYLHYNSNDKDNNIYINNNETVFSILFSFISSVEKQNPALSDSGI